jgi:pimeloyl-ACP methyl ester carboxylesterase
VPAHPSRDASVLHLPVRGSSVNAAQRSPNRLLTFCEPLRASMELGGLMASAPILLAAPRGDGHPVLVLPGLSGGAGWTTLLRHYLQSIGHSVHRPRFAATKGSSGRVYRLLSERVDELADRHGGPVSLVGWSVGGCLARQVAAAQPSQVRQVITLGTPLDGKWYPQGQQRAAGPLKVPVTAIISRTDGIFEWRRCIQPGSARAENVEVPSSHLGLASNQFAYHVIADRLGQPQGSWRPYAAPLTARAISARRPGRSRRPPAAPEATTPAQPPRARGRTR